MLWHFEPSDPMGGAAGEAFASALSSTGLGSGHMLAREAIQNSVDAALPDTPKVAVQFRAERLTGQPKLNFCQHAGLRQIAERYATLQLRAPNCLRDLQDAGTPLDLLYVEDYGCEGLSGKVHDWSSNFFRLLLSLGDRTKARADRGKGGSYGYGKAVYSASSRIQTIVAHTRFRDESGRYRTRVFGCGYYASHNHLARAYSGRAWLGGEPRQNELNQTVVEPLEEEPAEALADALGFTKRSGADTGTSILIVDSLVDPQEIVSGVEEWWWPRIVDDDLDVIIVDYEGNRRCPRPRRRIDLQPFIVSYEIAIQRAAPKQGRDKFQRLNDMHLVTLGDTQMGTLGFTVLPPAPEGSPEFPEARTNAVALIRAPRMVVCYDPMSKGRPSVVGAYVASDHVDEFLRKSEPLTHDRWDSESINLRDETDDGAFIVESVLKRVKKHLRQFQSEVAPPPPPTKRTTLLERELTAYFRASGKTSKQPPRVDVPLHIEFPQRPRPLPVTNNRLRLRSVFTVYLDESCDEDHVPLQLTVKCPVIEDVEREGDDLRCDVVECRGASITPDAERPNTFKFTLAKNVHATFTVQSEDYDARWTVRLRPELTREPQP